MEIKLECGCKFKVVSNNNGLSQVDCDIEQQIEEYESCPLVWEMLASGVVKGVFQVEGWTGQRWIQKIFPQNLEELATFLAIIRPGVTDLVLEDGKTALEHYILRKNGKEPSEPVDPSIREITASTEHVLCIEEDTHISTTNAEVKIKDLKPLDNVLSLNRNTFKIENDTCANVVQSRVEDGYEIRLSNGYTIVLTKDHKVLTYDGMKEVQDLDINNDLVAVRYKTENVTNSVHKDFTKFDFLNTKAANISYLLGQIVGDGYVAGSQNIICSGEKENTNRLHKWITKNIPTLKQKKYFNTRSWYIQLSHPELLRSKNHGPRKTKFRHVLEHFDMIHKCRDKVIPSQVFDSNEEIQLSFLAGLLDSDGMIKFRTEDSATIISICSINKNIIDGVCRLLSNLGVSHFIDSEYQHVYITDATKFKNYIEPYLVVRNFNQITKFPTRDTTGYIPRKDVKDFVTKNKNCAYTTYCRNRGVGENILNTQSKFMNHNSACKLGFITKDMDIRYMQIKHITNIGKKTFYSISVDKNRNLIGNGIIISNCFQEQVLAISSKVAGFDLKEADKLRKAIGSKNTALMTESRELFIEKAKIKQVVSEEKAIEIFNMIQKSQRYLFVKSHAIGYAKQTLASAYLKVHTPLLFTKNWLKFAEYKNLDRDEEIEHLVEDAKIRDILVKTPDFRIMTDDFHVDNKKNTVLFGFNCVKQMGHKTLEQARKGIVDTELQLGKSVEDWQWHDFLLFYSPKIDSKAVESLIKCGALDYFKVSRNRMLYEFSKIHSILTDKEREWLQKNYGNIENLPQALDMLAPRRIMKAKVQIGGGGTATVTRSRKIYDLISRLQNPPKSMRDNPYDLSEMEKTIMGVSLSTAKIESFDTTQANFTLDQIRNLRGKHKNICVCGIVHEKKVWKIKKQGNNFGKFMAKITISDGTAKIDSLLVFPSVYELKSDLIEKGMPLGIFMDKSDKDGAFFVNDVWKLKLRDCS